MCYVDVAGHVVVVNRSPLRLAWDTHFVGDLRAVNNNFLDMVRLKSNHSLENWTPVSARRLSAKSEQNAAAPSASATCGRASDEPFKWAVRLRARDGIEFDFIADEVGATPGSSGHERKRARLGQGNGADMRRPLLRNNRRSFVAQAGTTSARPCLTTPSSQRRKRTGASRC